MPLFVHLEISRLNRLALIVVRGRLTLNAASDVLAQLAAARVPAFAKIIDISGMSVDPDRGRVKRLAVLLRRACDASQGRVALVVDGERAFGKGLAELLADDSQVAVVRSLQEARIFVRRELINVFDDMSQAAD